VNQPSDLTGANGTVVAIAPNRRQADVWVQELGSNGINARAEVQPGGLPIIGPIIAIITRTSPAVSVIVGKDDFRRAYEILGSTRTLDL
jgi:hypothetical protein